ncbi:10318_t:CDS:2, partial [Gigaspora rosea]
MKIASGYLKEMAAKWYKGIKEKQFALEERQHRWQIKLYELKQKDTEKVDAYTAKFKKLLSRVNVDNS